MISQWFIDMGVGFMGWFFGLFPDDFTVPDFLLIPAEIFSDLVEGSVGMGAWIPWALLSTVIGATVGLWLIGLTVKGIRWLVGLVPTMGGG